MTPYFASTPNVALGSLAIAGVADRSVVSVDDAVRLQLEVLAGRRQVEADQRAGARDAEHAARHAGRRGTASGTSTRSCGG